MPPCQRKLVLVVGRALRIAAIGIVIGALYLRNKSHEALDTIVIKEPSVADMAQREIVFLLIVCSGPDSANGSSQYDDQDEAQSGRVKSMADSPKRQLTQTQTFIKSAIALTSWNLRYIVMGDSMEMFHSIKSVADDWPQKYRSKVKFQFTPLSYPENRVDMRNMFRTCATARLFIPDALKDEKALIYIDTDFVFLRPPEDLWLLFQKFDSKQIAGMAPCLNGYTRKTYQRIPYFGESGLNGGLMLMNLTRIRSFQKGWVAENLRLFDQYKRHITQADQDILNLFFNKYPDQLHEIGCEWNYRMCHCRGGRNKCPLTSEEGVSLLHGNGLAFFNSNKERRIKAIFEMWVSYRIGTPLGALLGFIRPKLQRLRHARVRTTCSALEDIDTVLTARLHSTVTNITTQQTAT